MEIRVLRDERDYEAALAEIGALWEAPAGSPDAERLAVMAVLVEAYEREHHEILPPDPVDAIKFRMAQQEMSQAQLSRALGVGPSHISEILNRRRGLSMSMVKALHRELGIPLESLIGESSEAA